MRTQWFPLIALLAHLAYGLEVAPNSPCAKKCLDDPKNGNPVWSNASQTLDHDLACVDSEYIGRNATKVGKKFADCQTCMQSSGWEDSGSDERDTTWFLFNNRGAADWCLFGRFAKERNDDVSVTEPYKQCYSACKPIYAASNYRIEKDPKSYDFCDRDGNYTSDAEDCISCLYNGKGLTILGNIVSTIVELCKTQPSKNITFDAEIYNTTRIKLSDSTPTPSHSSSPPKFSSSASSDDSSDLSKGAIAGIVLGGLVAIAFVLGGILFFLSRLKKRNKTVDPHSSGASAISDSSYQYTPVQGHSYAHHPEPRSNSELGAAERAGLEHGSSGNGDAELRTSDPMRRY